MKLPEYRSIAEKKSKYLYVKIDDKKTLDSHLRNLLESSPRCICRGLREARYKLFTSVQREWLTNGLGRHTTIDGLVGSLLHDIRKHKVLNDYFTSLNIEQTDPLYLSLLQHYSAPTPLLDFTHNHRVALYFATDGVTTAYSGNDIDDYFSLYYIDLDKVGTGLIRMDDFLNRGLKRGKAFVEELEKTYSIDKSSLDNLDELTKWQNPRNLGAGFSDFPLIFIDNPLSTKQIITPYAQNTLYWSNLNIIAQEGCFLLYNYGADPLEEYMDGNRCFKLWCLDIHKSLADYIRANYLPGITKETLFPDITRMARQAYIDFKERL